MNLLIISCDSSRRSSRLYFEDFNSTIVGIHDFLMSKNCFGDFSPSVLSENLCYISDYCFHYKYCDYTFVCLLDYHESKVTNL